MKSEILAMKLETDLGLPVPEKKKKKTWACNFARAGSVCSLKQTLPFLALLYFTWQKYLLSFSYFCH